MQWTECDPTILGSANTTLDQLQSSNRLRCSLVRAPLDWANPERGDVVLSLMRLAAATPDKRRGALLLNPGGPGVDGLEQALMLLEAFSQSNPDSPQGAMQLRLLNEYDAVGFSPRGTGASTQLQCATNELARPVDTTPTGWDTPENLANAHYNGRKTAEACLKNPITPYINTDATARDMDLLRGLLGEEKLNYLGYSYGTWLGAWYASLFPEKVGRMVLDSSIDFSDTLEPGTFEQAPLRQYLLDHILAPYAARHADHFQLGASADEVRAAVAGLSPRMQALLAESLAGASYSRTHANQYLITISTARLLDSLLKTAPDPADLQAMESALKEHVFDPSNQGRDDLIRDIAKKLLEKYATTWIKPKTESIALNAAEAAFNAVNCNDTPSTTDLGALSALVRGLIPRAPLFAPAMVSFNTCAFWGGPKVDKPGLEPLKPLDILLVQSQYDTATDTVAANHFFAQLPAARRVYVSGEYQHAIYPYEDSCVDPVVTRYLLGESPTQREAVCQGHPLELDQAAKAAGEGQPSAYVPPTYTDPEKARELIDAFKQGMIPRHPRR